MKNKLLLGTDNLGKLKEIQFYLKYFKLFLNSEIKSIKDFKDLGEPKENGLSFQDNARIKSKYFSQLTNLTTISDDSGFIVDDLKDYPGIKTARVAEELGSEQRVIDKIFSQFANTIELNATFYCALSLVGEEGELSYLGKVHGKIIPQKKGSNGFGYDPYFIPNKEVSTFAEMTKEKKMMLSHRFHAFNVLASQI